MKVPQLSPFIGDEEYKAIKSCFDDNWITEGPKSALFVEKILKLTGAKYGVLAPNGTLALYLGLRAIGVGPGDEVIIPDFTFIASATSVEMTGATPVFCDVNPRNFQIDIKSAAKRLTNKTKAIMPVHIYGTVCNMDEVVQFARKNKIKIIEDAAEALDVHWKNKHAGTFGDVGCLSFFADKTITTGEGGMILTDDKLTYEKLLYLRNQGRINRGSFIHPTIGYNFRMTDLQTSVGLAQLQKLNEIKKKKDYNLNLYKKLLKDIPEIKFFEPEKGAEFIPFRVGLLYQHAQELMDYLKSVGIEPRTFFYPLHKQPAFSHLVKDYNFKEEEFENSNYGFNCGVCLPVFPSLTKKQIKYVCDSIKKFISAKEGFFYEYYDLLNSGKDYKSEVDLLLSLYNRNTPPKLLEIGCGTGNHTVYLSKHAKEIVAVDIDKRMVEVAKNKFAKRKINNVKLFNSEIFSVKEDDFDMAVAMFNVVTYIRNMTDLNRFFKEITNKLKTGGVFIFDAWNGIAAIKDPPKVKTSSFKLNKTKTLNLKIVPSTDLLQQTVDLDYQFRINQNIQSVSNFTIHQTLWTPKQINDAAVEAGMTLVKKFPLMNPEKNASDSDWKIMYMFVKE